MKSKVAWLILSWLTVVLLLMASCAPAAPKEEVAKPKEEVAKPKEEVVAPGKEMVRDTLGRLVEKPQYGGWLTMCEPQTPLHLGFGLLFELRVIFLCLLFEAYF